MRNRLFQPFVLALLAAFMALPVLTGCPTPGPKLGGLVDWPTKDEAIDCTKDEVRKKAEASLEDVIGILAWEDFTDVEHWKGPAKEGFIDIVQKLGSGGVEAVLCMIGWKEGQFTAAASSNPNDIRAVTMDERAEAVLADFGYELILGNGERYVPPVTSGTPADSMSGSGG